ncbi:MAG TPA: GtrA family protein, partial [Actinotalea sp.]|nr:GtrA family protein [Actinotalea sp.]
MNTVIDLVLYVALRALGLPLLMANGISTTCGLVFSLVANHRFTFRDRVNRPRRTVPLFIVVTVFGLWGLQPLAIAASQAWLVPLVGLDPGTPLASGLAKLAGIAIGVKTVGKDGPHPL